VRRGRLNQWGSCKLLFERHCSARRGRLETGQQDEILPHSYN